MEQAAGMDSPRRLLEYSVEHCNGPCQQIDEVKDKEGSHVFDCGRACRFERRKQKGRRHQKRYGDDRSHWMTVDQ
jgi:hypothetical protein